MRLSAALGAGSVRIAPGMLRRGLWAALAWGVSTGCGLAALQARNCGVLCLEDALAAVAVCIATGLVTIGPLAAFGRLETSPRSAVRTA